MIQNQAQPTHITLMRDPTDDISDVFHELRKISGQIKQKRQDTEVLYNQWLSLYAQIKPVLSDPFADKQ